MTNVTDTDLQDIARKAAELVAGPAAVEQVEVRRGHDVEQRPAYHFTFLIDYARAEKPRGLVRIRLIQALQDMLGERDDDHRPVVRILTGDDWEKRAHGAFS